MRRKSKKYNLVIGGFILIVFLLAIILVNYCSDYKMKYVLIWTRSNSEPFLPLRSGDIFYNRNCPVQNCYVTSDRKFFKNFSKFDAILFHGPEIVNRKQHYFPKERSAHQSYIFTSMESSHNYRVPDTRFHDVFNFTWTYKLDSDISFKYMVIRDKDGKVIGPNKTIDWISIDNMLPIDDTIKSKLTNKSIAAAWIVSNCKTNSQREKKVMVIDAELRKYNMTLHFYGACASKGRYFPQKHLQNCLDRLQRDYYFYFAFENSFSEDYVTEKLRNALQNYAVPVVYGGADYKRFMPDGIYLDASKMSASQLVKQMFEIINNKEVYYDFFKWHNYYSYHHPEETAETDPYCALCSFINKINQSKVFTIENFYDWWNPDHSLKMIKR